MKKLNDELKDVLSHVEILKRAEKRWNNKSIEERKKSGRKYHHIFKRLNCPNISWDKEFSKLVKPQINILVKGELIRTYDSMPNSLKTNIKKKFGLSSFSSKWFRLSPSDKKILLNSILKNEWEKEK